MAETSMFWNGEVLGDCGPYQQSHLMDTFFRALLNGTGNHGVLRGWMDELEVSGTSSPLRVATGAALVYGMFYQSDSPVAFTIPRPTTGTRTDLIVLRREWTAQTVRLARLEGPGAALTQTANLLYEIPLASVEINTDGEITVTDTREWIQYSTDWPDDAVDTEHYAEGAITPDLIPDRTRYELKDAGSIRADSANPATWTVGADYDYWSFADGATNTVWCSFVVPTGTVDGEMGLYIWTTPNVDGAGAGAETVDWDWVIYYGPDGGIANNTLGSDSFDQQARDNANFYRDELLPPGTVVYDPGSIFIVQLDRDGGGDVYASAVRLLGIEVVWTADN